MEAKTIEKDMEWLRRVSKEVSLGDKELKNDLEVLRDYSLNNGVLAMAAIQLGIDKRLIYIKNTDVNNLLDRTVDESIVLINPVIEKMEGLTTFWEACASCLNNMGMVLRPYKVTISYMDLDGNKLSKVFEGFGSTVFCHEYDHLDGILHMDKSLEMFDMEPEDRAKFREDHPYEILEKTGDYKKLVEEYGKRNKN